MVSILSEIWLNYVSHLLISKTYSHLRRRDRGADQNYAGVKETTVPCAPSPPPSVDGGNAQNNGTASVYQQRRCHYLSRSGDGSQNSHRRDQGEIAAPQCAFAGERETSTKIMPA
ncbi:hypothetical protein Fot_05163 [Forsythia ovata]|uniref:Uncharacterized protein n=1 Tax=Forsythia ovata TaxID=205694 RepID=A0ABD1WPF1_9LAMI